LLKCQSNLNIWKPAQVRSAKISSVLTWHCSPSKNSLRTKYLVKRFGWFSPPILFSLLNSSRQIVYSFKLLLIHLTLFCHYIFFQCGITFFSPTFLLPLALAYHSFKVPTHLCFPSMYACKYLYNGAGPLEPESNSLLRKFYTGQTLNRSNSK
jgi:hypothetical protein